MKAFSLIELIFVIVIMGILTFLGLQYMPNEKVTAYSQMLKAKIMEKKSNALGYKTTGNDSYYCIKFDKVWLKNDEANSKVRFDFNKSYISLSVTPALNNNMLCFDYIGRDFNGSVDSNLTNLLHTNIIITVKNTNNNEEQNITIYNFTGAVK
jgi:prepilin-type N-terminal cleavage/methylation domain-containing protein